MSLSSIFKEVVYIGRETAGGLINLFFGNYANNYNNLLRRATEQGGDALREAIAISIKIAVVAIKVCLLV